MCLSARRDYTVPHASAIPFTICIFILLPIFVIWLINLKMIFFFVVVVVFFNAKLLFHYFKIISISFLKLINLQLICNVRSIWNKNVYIFPLFQFQTQTGREQGTNQSHLIKCFKTIRWWWTESIIFFSICVTFFWIRVICYTTLLSGFLLISY